MNQVVDQGTVIAEIDEKGRFVELWVVTMIHLDGVTDKVEPYKARRACSKIIEDWGNRRWRFSHNNHRMKIPEGG